MGRLEYLVAEMRVCENDGLITHSKEPDPSDNVITQPIG